MAHPASQDRAGALRAEPPTESQAKPLIPCADPMERLIADALDSVGARYTTGEGGGNPSGLDFRLASGIEIEVKRFHSDRIAEQMSRAPNVIVAQGEGAVRFLAFLIRASVGARDE